MSRWQLVDDSHKFPSYKGGRTRLIRGYVWEYSPDHPLSNKWGWIAQHHLVAEDILGRPLLKMADRKLSECVHHKNHDPTDNRPENLAIMTKSAHHSYHSKILATQTVAYNTAGDRVAEFASTSASVGEVADKIGVHHQTVRNWWPDIVGPLKRSTPTDVSDPEVAKMIAPLAADPAWGTKDIATLFRCSEATVKKIVEIHSLSYVKKSRKGETHRTYRGRPIPSR